MHFSTDQMKKLFTFLVPLALFILAVSCTKPSDTSIMNSFEETSEKQATIESQTTVQTFENNLNESTPRAYEDSEVATPAEVRTISGEEAKAMMDQGGVTIVDVRRADEYNAGHIPFAILVPNETIAEEAENALPDKNAVLLIYCRSGRRSKEAAEILVSLGYQNVYDFGGILDWEYEITTE